jgi:hypothetical protein
MVSIELTHEDLIVRIRGWDKLRAMRSTLTIPLGHVTGVRAQPEEAHFDDVIIESWRGVGTYVPGKRAAGTCYVDGGRFFFDVQDPQKTIAIDVKGEAIQRIVVELADEAPEQAVQRIQRALAGLRVN